MAKVPNDYELDFLKSCSSEQLEPIVGAILGTENGEINRSGRFSSELDSTLSFTCNYPDHTKYVDEIIEEIQKFGGNTLVNLMRHTGVSYHEVLCDVATKMKVNFKKTQKTEMIESSLLAKVLDDAWEKMSESERDQVLKESGSLPGVKIGGIGAGAAIAIFRAGGFESYKLALIIVNAVSKAILGHGLKLAGNAYLARLLAVLAGPVGWIATGVWTAFDVASEAYRVTIPACIYVAALRIIKKNEQFAEHPEEIA